MFAWLPIESVVHDRQKEYYESINRSNENGESSAFISFMLSAIKDALTEAMQTEHSGRISTDELRRQQIEQFLAKNGTVTNADVRELMQVSPATANRILAKLVKHGVIRKIRLGKQQMYVADSNSENGRSVL